MVVDSGVCDTSTLYLFRIDISIMPAIGSIATELEHKATEHLETLTSQVDSSLYSEELWGQLKTLMIRSDFATKTLLRYPDMISVIKDPRFNAPLGGDIVELRDVFKSWLNQSITSVDDEAQFLDQLRKLRHCALTLITYYDMIIQQPIQDSLKQVSVLADEFILLSYEWFYHSLKQRYGAPQCETGDQPLCIIAMGKLGGYELNFSSDIDLIFAYPSKGNTLGGKKQIENQQFFMRLAQKLIFSLDSLNANGFVYRVDMRLRPFGDSGPLVTHFDALEDYYQEQGREWERYAMVKARIVNQQSPSTLQLSALLQPFIYRRYIDFTALDSLRSMKMLIEKEVRRKRLTNNIKLGAGGIREVEFLVQSLQLIHAGKHRELQTPKLCDAVDGMLKQGLLEQSEAEQLLFDYHFLRKIEHCLQQFGDQQTQKLPDDEIDQFRLIDTLGFSSWQAFHDSVEQAMTRIHTIFKALIKTPEKHIDTSDPTFELCEDLWTIQLDQKEWMDAFETVTSIQMQKTECLQLFAAVQDLRKRLQTAAIGERGQNSISRLIPQLLFDLLNVDEQNIVEGFGRISPIIVNIAGRTPYLNLLLENHGARLQLIQLGCKSPWIADQLARFPLLLDELLDPSYLSDQSESVENTTRRLASQLQQSMLRIDPDDLEAMMNAWRQFKLCQQMIIAAADITEHLPTNRVSDYLTALATVLVDAVMRYAWKNISIRYGEPTGKNIDDPGLSIVAYGKFGGLELGYGSDLDLVFLHDAAANSQTNGKKSISAQHFYVKVVQRFLHLMTTPMQLGEVYDIDLRLRPDGSSGMLCSHINSYTDYQLNQAWTWEHQAIVRTRIVWGCSVLSAQFSAVKKQVLSVERNIPDLRAAVSEMREKMRSHLLRKKAGLVDLKQSIGGITDIEFLVQYCVLAYAKQKPNLTKWSDNLRLLDEIAAANTLSIQQAQSLQHCYLYLRKEIHRSNLQNQELVKLSDVIQNIMETVKREYLLALDLS